MRIAILIPNFVEFDGGAQNARIQAEELVREGHYVAIFTFAADIKPENVEIFVMAMPKSSLWERVYRLLFPLDFPKALKWLPKLKNFDHIIAYYYPMTWFAYLAKKFYKVKYTFRYSGIMDPKLFPHLHEKIYMRLHIFFTKLTVRNADHAISVSKFAGEELKKYTGLDSEIVHDLVDAKRFHVGIDGSSVREALGLGEAPVMLSVGTIRPVKGFLFLVKAFNLITKEIPEARLIIIGKPDFDYYFEQMKQISSDSITFIDCIPNKDLPYYYAACDLYVTCSFWECCNRPALEVQACGKPVIAWHESFRAILDENGTLVESGNIAKFAQACLEKLR